MAINSVAERWSMMNLMSPWRAPVFPDNLISAGDRLHFLLLYSGIPAAEPGGASAATDYLIHSKAIAQFTTVTDTTTSAVLSIIGNTHFILAGSVDTLHFSIAIADGSSVDLSGFTFEAQIVKDGDWIELQSAWGDAADENAFAMHSPDNLEGLVHETSGMAILKVKGLWAGRFKSKMASVPGEAVRRTLEVAVALS